MLKIHELRPAKGAKKRHKRVGRGPGSGHGKTSTRGHKGQKARSGSKFPPTFEGGQMPLVRRIPKRGFRSKSKFEYQIVNIGSLNKFKENTEINSDALKEVGLIKNPKAPVKILADGILSVPLFIRAHAFSKSAIEAIKKAGGKTEIIA